MSCDTLYIVTSPSSPCPGEYIGVPCLTLQQYASNPLRQSQNITFIVEPGMYNLSTLLTVSDGYNFTMSSTNATVTCTSATAKFDIYRIDNVYISGMTFQGCRNTAIRISQATSASIVSSNFINNQGSSGGGLNIQSSSVTIAESEFRNNSNGGAIYARSSTIKTSQFSYNTRLYSNGGGAIYASFSNITVNGSVFTYNNAYVYSGVVEPYIFYISCCSKIFQIINTMFIGNSAYYCYNIDSSGGAIYTAGQSISTTVIQCQFINNTAYSFGGAVYVLGTNPFISVFDSHFINNTAMTEGGGAIYSNGQYANVTLTSSTFHNNSASYCGVLDVDNYNHFSVNLTNSIFTYNSASGQTIGGGVACIRNASINVIDSTFKHNFANFHAGVFYIDESHTTVDGSLFINNSAALDGGVFYTYIHASDYIIRRSQFSENMAGDDGGVMLIGRLNCYVSIDETIFDFNSAGDRGGVVAIIASSMFMEINRTNIFNNTAQFGGVISACNSEVTVLDDSLFVTVDPLLYTFLYALRRRYPNLRHNNHYEYHTKRADSCHHYHDI